GVDGIGEEVGGKRVDVELLTGADTVAAFDGFADEVGRAIVVGTAEGGGASEAPVGHRGLGLQLEAPPEGSFGFVIPEGMKQSITLVEPALHFWIGGSDGEVRRANAGDGPRLFARTRVERFAMLGMSEFAEQSRARRLKGEKGRRE